MPSSNKVLTTATAHLPSEKMQCLKEARNLFKIKKIVKRSFNLKLQERRMESIQTLYHHKVYKRKLDTPLLQLPVTTITSTYYNYTPQVSNYPNNTNVWPYLCTPITVIPVPVPVVTPVFPTMVTPILSPISPQSYVWDNSSNGFNHTNVYYSTVYYERAEDSLNEQTCQIQEIDPNLDINSLDADADAGDNNTEVDGTKCDFIESYLKLPKELFPTPNMLALDPNPIIDEFCKVPNLQSHIPWILDLEFGVPKSPITRPIPTLNVKFNSIHCKNTPDAIHPGFESCDPDFKKVLLYNYDCIVSAWYRGYMIFHSDTSIENFQSWLLLPTEVLGMCWP